MGRFASPDTLVPDPGNPQSFNRYAYVNNNPINYTDPTGHCINNYEAGSADLTTCLAGWNSVGNYLAEATYNSGGAFPNALYNDWLMNADIATLENLMSVYGIDYGYTFAPPAPATPSGPPRQSIATNTCNYWENCYDPVADYTGISVATSFFSFAILQDEAGNWYINPNLSTSYGVSVFIGSIQKNYGEAFQEIEDLAVDQRELAVVESMQGRVSSGCVSFGVQVCVAGNQVGDRAWQVGLALPPGISFSSGYTFIIPE